MTRTPCSLSALDGVSAEIQAPLNPNSIKVDKTVPWAKQVTNQSDKPALEFTHAEPRNLSFELLFDVYESGDSLQEKYIAQLELMTTRVEAIGRPPQVLFQWSGLKFYGAIESVSINYTMFKDDGTAVRATVNIKMKEAETLKGKATQDPGGEGGDGGAKDEGRNGVGDGEESGEGFPLR